MDKTTYLEKLTDPRWQKKRLEIMERDKFTCQSCGNKELTLNVHHTAYEKNKNPWEYDNNTMVTICKNCHEIYHGLKKEFGCFGKYKLQVHCTMDYADDYNYFVIYHSNLYVAIKVNAEEPNYSFKFYHCVELPLLRGLIHFLQENDTWH
ncbi:MAG: HNH endonuclease [Chitinophagales bacterium]|nr:HNH endonuclease [Chitinophagales bacterium]